jgi:acyl-CoA dehydrogenase
MNVLDRLDQAIPLAPEEQQLVESVRALARNEIAPRAEGYDRTGEFPRDNIRALNRLGLNAMFVPDEYGGAQMSYTAYLECLREISKACASTGGIWATNFHFTKPLLDFGSAEQKRRLLPVMVAGGLGSLTITEPGAGGPRATGSS